MNDTYVSNHDETLTFLVGSETQYYRSQSESAAFQWKLYVRPVSENALVDAPEIVVIYYLHPSFYPRHIVVCQKAPFEACGKSIGEFPVRIRIYMPCLRLASPVDLFHAVRTQSNQKSVTERLHVVRFCKSSKRLFACRNPGGLKLEPPLDSILSFCRLCGTFLATDSTDDCRRDLALQHNCIDAKHHPAVQRATGPKEHSALPRCTDEGSNHGSILKVLALAIAKKYLRTLLLSMQWHRNRLAEDGKTPPKHAALAPGLLSSAMESGLGETCLFG